MLPAFLLRVGIDWVRHDPTLHGSNPYSRCEEAIKIIGDLWRKEFGPSNDKLLKLAIITTYWQELFHAEDPLPDEQEWREGLIKRSSHYDSFDEWQDWFKNEYAKAYKENDIWHCIVRTAWARTHQYDVMHVKNNWAFLPSRSYLPTSQMWRLEPHISIVADLLKELWLEEIKAYKAANFIVNEASLPFPIRCECLGFDSKTFTLIASAKTDKKPETLEVADMVADIVLPVGDSWYRHLDNIIFADNCVDVTSLVSRARYVFGSRRRLLELCVEKDLNEARMQAQSEGWLVETSKEEVIDRA